MLIEILQPTRTKKNASAQKKKKKEHGDDETSIHTLTHTHKHTRIQNHYPNHNQNLGSMDRNRSDRVRTYKHFKPGGPWNPDHVDIFTHKHTRIQNPNNYQNLGSTDQNRSERAVCGTIIRILSSNAGVHGRKPTGLGPGPKN